MSKYLIIILLSLFLLSCQQEERIFKLVILPDTQTYTEKYPAIFEAQAKWIAANADSFAYVIHVGGCHAEQ